jgi:hypothetical protein
LLGACSRRDAAVRANAKPATAAAAPVTLNAVPAAANSALGSVGSPPTTAVAVRGAKPVPPTTATPGNPGEDFIESGRELFRVAACGGTSDVPAKLDRWLVDNHCTLLTRMYEAYKARWLAKAEPFLSGVRPSGLPTTVVYPFGGGDLVTALAVFPDATDFTTISLEPAGDVRHIDSVTRGELKGALGMQRRHLRKLLGLTYSRTTNLGLEERAAIPGEIVFLMAALVVHGYEPVSLRYFGIENDGSLRYVDAAGVAESDRVPQAFGDPPTAAFTNVEIAYRRAGSNDPPKIVRHIAQDLSDQALHDHPGLIAYLEQKGRVSAMTKAASHLLWADEFSDVRDYLLKSVDWMISDSTGIPPRFARAAGFVEDTFGHFDGPAKYGPIEARDSKDFRKLFAENPRRTLPFQFGYADVHRQIHMVVMRRGQTAAR